MKTPITLLRNIATRLTTPSRTIFIKNRKRFARTSARLLLLAGFFLGVLTLTAASPIESRPNEIAVTPTLGNYPNTSLPLSTDTTVTPDAAPTNAASMNVSTSTNFKGKLEGNPTTGVVRVTDAHPAGTYTVTVKAFDTGGLSASKTFTVTVTTPVTCNPLTFAVATNFGTGDSPVSVAVGDFNRDGKQDFVTANLLPSTVSIRLGDGAGSFGAATTLGVGEGPYSVAVGDFNGDGKQDLVTANSGPNSPPGSVSILLGDGAGGFGAATNFSILLPYNVPYFVAVGDFNGDGRQDLAVAVYNAGVSIFLGDGTGSFSAPTSFFVDNAMVALVVGDFNGDGKQDLAAVTESGSATGLYVVLGDGTGSFGAPTGFPAGYFLSSVAVGDFNGDGKQDLATSGPGTNSVWILLGDGAGSFSTATPFYTSASGSLGLAVGDFNGDGKQDLAVGNGLPTVSILLGDGAGNFGAAMLFGVGPVESVLRRSVAVGDFNGDGKQDLAATNQGSDNVSILLRDCTTPPTSAVSRKTHGGAGSFDINLPLPGLPGSLGVECRSGGTTNDYQLVVTYPANVTVNGNPQAQVTYGAGAIGSGGTSNGGMVAVSGNTVTIPLTNITNAQVKNVRLYSVNGGGDLIIPLGVVVGDLNASHGVNATDVSTAKLRVGQAVDATNFRADVLANGAINATDVSSVKLRSGTAIP
jgi:hypothetical protein